MIRPSPQPRDCVVSLILNMFVSGLVAALSQAFVVYAACNSTVFTTCMTQFYAASSSPALVCSSLPSVLSCVTSSGCQDSDTTLSFYPTWPSDRNSVQTDCAKGLTKPPNVTFAPPLCSIAMLSNCTRNFTDFADAFSGLYNATSLNHSCSNLAVASACVVNSAHCNNDSDSLGWTNRRNIAQFICSHSAEFLQSQSCFRAKSYNASITSRCPNISQTVVNCSAYNSLLSCQKEQLTQVCDPVATEIYARIQGFDLQLYVQVASILTNTSDAAKNCTVLVCAEYCLTCTTQGIGKCDVCNTGYHLNNYTSQCEKLTTTCPKAGAGCISCTVNNPADCTACKSGLGLSITTPHFCQACNTNPTCSNCTSISVCTQCMLASNTPYKNGTAACGPCSSNCSTCGTSGPGLCDVCLPGFRVSNLSHLCEPCQVTNCRSCTTSGVTRCDVCSTTYFPVTSSNKTQCARCSAQCSGCPVNGGGFCDYTKCTAGYGLNNSTKLCEQCSPNCRVCPSNGAAHCDDCISGYILNSSTKLCQ